MALLEDILDEIQTLVAIGSLAETYQEIAGLRMRRVKQSVLKNRAFLDQLRQVYYAVESSYRDEVAKLVAKRTGKKNTSSLLRHNGKQVSVLLSSNTMLYGAIIRETFSRFEEYIEKNETDIVIIGRVGRQLFEASASKRDYQYFDASDSDVLPERLVDIVSHILQYERVVVFHGKFEHILSQVPMQTIVSGESPSIQEKGFEKKYLFEPSLEDVLVFFESEILAVVFEQSVHESNLAKFASRMISLEEASENIRDNLREAEFDKRRLEHRMDNRKQLNRLSGMSIWGV